MRQDINTFWVFAFWVVAPGLRAGNSFSLLNMGKHGAGKQKGLVPRSLQPAFVSVVSQDDPKMVFFACGLLRHPSSGIRMNSAIRVGRNRLLTHYILLPGESFTAMAERTEGFSQSATLFLTLFHIRRQQFFLSPEGITSVKCLIGHVFFLN